MPDKEMSLVGKRIGIVGKGGAGKSTVTFLIAKALRRRNYEVCILDADSTNVGFNKILDLPSPPKSLIEFFGGMVFSGGLVTCPVDDPTPLPNSELALEEIPGEYYVQNQDGIMMLAAGKIGDLGPGAGCDGPINKIARDVRILYKGRKPVTLVDFKAGFEDSARGAITSLDWVLTVVDPTHAAIQMAIQMKNMVAQLKAGVPPATEHLESQELVQLAVKLFKETEICDVLAILNRIRDSEMEEYIRSKLLEGGVETIGSIHDDPSITASWLKGIPFDGKELSQKADDIVATLEKMAGNRL
jgi:CO dehydrogenase maturation factor